MGMKITLIYPGIVKVGFNSLGKGGMDRNWINLGLAYIGAYLKKYSYDVDLVDLRELQDWDQVRAEMKYRLPDVFGVHFNTPNYNNALECCKMAKELKKIVVAGGPHASVAPDDLITTGYVDYVIIGEGEISFLELLENLRMNRQRERIIQGKPVENLDELPFPDRDLYSLKKILHPIGNFPFMDNGLILMTSRGCPFNCAFCQPLARKMFGRKVRYRSVENVIEELKYIISRYKVKYISFQDDTFTARKEWVLELCWRIREEKLAVQWSAQSRVDTFDEELAEAMSTAGCVCLFFGFESGSQRILNFLRKGITPEQSLETAKLCKKYGIIIFADYMLGVPTETEEDLRQTLTLIKEIKPELPSPTYFTPIPGCDLYDYCKENNLIKIETYEDFTRNPTSEKINGIDYALLEKYKRIMLGYTPKWYQEKHFTKLTLKRWLHLVKLGYFKFAFHEIFNSTFIYRLGIRAKIRRVVGALKGG